VSSQPAIWSPTLHEHDYVDQVVRKEQFLADHPDITITTDPKASPYQHWRGLVPGSGEITSHDRPVRASRDISMPRTTPTRPIVTSATSLAKPFRESGVAADTPRSSSITVTCDRAQPRATARSASAYCSRVGSVCPRTCCLLAGGRKPPQPGPGAQGGSSAAAAPAAGNRPGSSRPPPAVRPAALAASSASSAITAVRRSGGRTVQTRGSGATAFPVLGRIALTCRR
jgi:hypothetical protein